jgi:transcriptional regulator with XRE-family HTH domain
MEQPDLPLTGAETMAPVNRTFFENLMQGKGVSLRSLATKMGKTHSQLSLTLSGNRNMPLEEAAFWSEYFGVPLYQVAQNVGIEVRTITARRASIVGHMNGLGVVELDGSTHLARVIAPDDMPEGGIAVQARTTHTELEYADGWLYFCAAPRSVEHDIVGRLCYCQIKDGPAVLAGVRRGYLPGTFNLYGPHQHENAVLEWATPVLKINT